MTITVKLSHDYPFSPENVWTVATDLGHLKTITHGLLNFRNLPRGQIYKGQHIKVQISLFGKLPYQPYEMTVLTCDPATMSFHSQETGAGVKSWDHALSVIPTKTGSRIEEEITIDAGLATWVFAIWARVLYRRRHAPRLKILEGLANSLPHDRSSEAPETEGEQAHKINGFHAHVYFDNTSMDAAAKLCEQAAQRFGVDLGRMHTRPIGPHPMPSCQLDCTNEQFSALLPWLIGNRGDLSILCHGKSSNHLADHTRNAFWLGEPHSLGLSLFN